MDSLMGTKSVEGACTTETKPSQEVPDLKVFEDWKSIKEKYNTFSLFIPREEWARGREIREKTNAYDEE